MNYFLEMNDFDFPVTFASEISPADQAVVLRSPLWRNWAARAQLQFVLQAVHFSSADIISRKGEKTPLFIKLKATATDHEGKPQHGITLLRGSAVGVLVVLRCEGKPYLLLVDQPRFPLGERHMLEIPAGILDWSDNPVEIALAELREEAQIEATASELVDLTEFWEAGAPGFAASCGLLDETIRLYLLEREVTPAELRAHDGREQDYQDEHEWIQTVVLPYEDAARRFRDGKGFVALFLYERWLALRGRVTAP